MHIDVRTDRAMCERTGSRRPWMQLLSAVLDLAGGEAELLRHSERPWASATFSGSRHTIALAFSGQAGLGAADHYTEVLAEHEFTLSRQIVADAAVTAFEQSMLPQPRAVVEAEFLILDDL